MARNVELTDEEKCKAITDAQDWLKANDYTATKMIYELAAKFKEQFPNVSLPICESYASRAEEADRQRQIINDNK